MRGRKTGGKKRRLPKDIFDSKYKKLQDGCWEWTGHVMNAGYGAISTYKGNELAHRWAYKYFVGEIRPKMTIDHLCKNKLCVNPSHMEMVTRKENINRAGLVGIAAKEAAKTHCIKGHEYSKYGVRYKNGYTAYGTTKYARRCTICYPFYARYLK